MEATINYKNKKYKINLAQPLDISIPLREGMENVNCFYAPPMETAPVIAGDFIGSTRQGGLLNFLNVRLNPHGNGTHTECVGHIAKEIFTINQCLKQFFFLAKLVTIYPQKRPNGDRVIEQEQLKEVLQPGEADALVIRTMPNDDLKKTMQHSGANPPFVDEAATKYIVHCGIEHLLIDLPSVDREEDGGKLLSHRAFWQYPDQIRKNSTITELIYAPDLIQDGFYVLNIQIASFEIDVSPSKPVLYKIRE